MHVIVTGAAGFIGSTLVDRLLEDGTEVTGLDCFTAYYERQTKERNLAAARQHPNFTMLDADLLDADLTTLFEGVDCVFHLAGQPGVRLSWSSGFDEYVRANVLATQRVLEAARAHEGLRVVYASSSSVYGNAERFPTLETDRPEPYSPYGVTKLAGEHLCVLYGSNWGVPTVSLRYFTVFGPRQRPDMATHRLIMSALTGEPFPMYGDGSQSRSFTFVGDIVEATRLAGITPDVAPGSVFNAAGPDICTLSEMIDMVTEHAGTAPNLERLPAAAGDAAKTGGDTTAIRAALGWECATSVSQGVAEQVEHIRGTLS